MDFYVDSPCKGNMELIQKLEFPGHLGDWGFVGQQGRIFETRVFWEILARMGEYAFQSFLHCSNFSCRSASSGEEEEGKRARNPCSSEGQAPSHLAALVGSSVALRSPTLK